MEALRGRDPERVLRLPGELREQVGDERLVLARRVGSAELVARPVARVEPGEEGLRRRAELLRERRGVGILEPLGVLEQREDRLELRVQDDLRVEAVEPDPRAARKGEKERRHRGEGARGRRGEGRVLQQRRRTGEGLRRNGLRHARRPRRTSAREAELVLPDQAATVRYRPRDESLREQTRRVRVVARSVVVQRAEVRERMKLETESRKPPVHDPVVARDVDAGGGQRVGLEVGEVQLELREERERAGRRVRARQRRQLRELRRDHVRTQRRQRRDVAQGARDRGAVALRVLRLDPALQHRVRDPAAYDLRVVGSRRRRDRRCDECDDGGDPHRRASHLRCRRGCRWRWVAGVRVTARGSTA